jgi:hypothetical protein
MNLGFTIIGQWLLWRIGNGMRLRIATNPWVGCGEGCHKSPGCFKFSGDLIEVLHRKGLLYLH